MTSGRPLLHRLALAAVLVVSACSSETEPAAKTEPPREIGPVPVEEPAPTARGSFASVVPLPVDIDEGHGEFVVWSGTSVVDESQRAGTAEATLRRGLSEKWGLELEGVEGANAITFAIPADGDTFGDEGYRIEAGPEEILVEATTAEGFGWAVQTLLGAFGPPPAEPDPDAALAVPTGSVRDEPRYGWRGVMLDLARHFFTAEEVMEVIDLAATYKINRLHLHLSDDQGWRIEIDAYPELAEVGGVTEVGGGEGGYLTKDEYARIVDHAADLGVVVVPEIDMPGHVNAALTAVPELNCDGVAPGPRTDTAVGYSSLCVGTDATEAWVREVIGELAAMTPGEWIHIGGDESRATSAADYLGFVREALDVVRSNGKTPVGWTEIGGTEPEPPVVIQHWLSADPVLQAAAGGADVVMSPSDRTYLDMKHDELSPIGNSWAGHIDTRQAYEWDPDGQVPGLDPARIAGVEGPLWTEYVETPAHIEQMLLPRLPALAEVAWTPQATRDWTSFAERIADHGARWDAAGLTWTRDPDIDW